MQIKQLNDNMGWNPKASLSFAIKEKGEWIIKWYSSLTEITTSNVNHGKKDRFNFTYGVYIENNDRIPF
jgi:hypothetical protein